MLCLLGVEIPKLCCYVVKIKIDFQIFLVLVLGDYVRQKQGGILFLTNQRICLLFGAKPITTRTFVLLPV